MKLIVSKFEGQAYDHVNYGGLVQRAGMSRIMFDLFVEQAKAEGLVTQDSDRDLRLTVKGKHYAIQHKIIR